ncbi:MAG: branched-chain amino acid ABC transporter permease [Rhizobiaceae bacterium]|nr:branched-chain amino acid ABC transporter permease [Rhizobiaceae bacterium]
MHDLLPVIAAGIVSGSAYALLALGIVIIFRSTDTVNFAIGDTATLGVFVSVTAMQAGAPVAVALLIAITFAGFFGVATERLLVRPLGPGHKSLFIALVVTIGLGLLIHAAIGAIWGHRPITIAPMVPGTVSVFGVALTWNKVIATAIAIVAMVFVAWFFRFTTVGVAMRASAEDHFAARVVGINPGRIAAFAWALGCGLAAIAAFFLAMETSANANLTISALFRAFAGVFLGGLTSMPGAAVGGFAIGILDNIAGRYLSANYRDTIVFAVIVAVLFIKPAGFLGAGRKERV